MRATVLFALVLAGCSANASDDHDPSGEFECNQYDRLGTFLVRFNQISGDCPTIPDFVVPDEARLGCPDGCECSAEWSDGDCLLTETADCADGDDDVGPYSIVMTTRQQDEAGRLFTGLLTRALNDASGGRLCVGTYDLRLERQ